MSDGARTSQIDAPVGGHTTGPTGAATVVVVVVDVVVLDDVAVDVVVVRGGPVVVVTAGVVVSDRTAAAVDAGASDDVAPAPSMSDEQPQMSNPLAARPTAPIGDRSARLTMEV